MSAADRAMRDALVWYADNANWEKGHQSMSAAECDGGDLARAALTPPPALKAGEDECVHCRGQGHYGSNFDGDAYCLCPFGESLKKAEREVVPEDAHARKAGT